VAMSREEIQNRLVTINGVLKRSSLTKRERERTLERKAELEEELQRLNQEESNSTPTDPEQVQSKIDEIWDILKKERRA
jgi:uncharacterized protein (DUF2225 family)